MTSKPHSNPDDVPMAVGGNMPDPWTQERSPHSGVELLQAFIDGSPAAWQEDVRHDARVALRELEEQLKAAQEEAEYLSSRYVQLTGSYNAGLAREDGLQEQVHAVEVGYKARGEIIEGLEREAGSLQEQLEAMRDALDKGRRFERAYQESLGATATATQYEILDNLQSAFLDAYLAVDSSPAKERS